MGPPALADGGGPDHPYIYFLDNLQIRLCGMPSKGGHPMSKTLRSARHDALIAVIVERRKRAGLTQADVAKRLKQYQSYVARVESGQRRIDVIEFIDLSEAIGFNPAEVIRRIVAAKR